MRSGNKSVNRFAMPSVQVGRSSSQAKAAASERKSASPPTSRFPSTLVFQVRYTNTSGSPITIDKWTNQAYVIPAREQVETPFWSFQSGSYQNRPSWVVPLKAGFQQENFQGMNSPDYGGGTPVSDVWRRDAGIAVGHIELVPKLVSLAGEDDGQFARNRGRQLCGETHLAARRNSGDLPHIRDCSPGRLLRRSPRIPQDHDRPGSSFPAVPSPGLRADLVRLGLSPQLQARSRSMMPCPSLPSSASAG